MEPVYFYGLPWAHVCDESEVEFTLEKDGMLTMRIVEHCGNTSDVDEDEFMDVLEACG